MMTTDLKPPYLTHTRVCHTSAAQGRAVKWAGYICVTVATFAAVFSLHPIAAAQMKEVRRVLLVNVFNPLSSPGVAALDQGIIASLEGSPYQIELYTEDLEM